LRERERERAKDERIAEEDVEWKSHERNILFCGKKEHFYVRMF
jgi:hypothetical protein